MHQNVLFIGNSHTYLHKMPWMIVKLAAAKQKGSTISIGLCTKNSAGLKDHWHDRITRDTISGKAWGTIVLQDRSGGPLEDNASFERYAALFDREIKRTGADTLFFMTWAHQKRPEDQENIARVYRHTARRHNAGLAPVGMAWQRSIRENPDLRLYHEDGRHAGPAGAYLAACVFYAVLFKASPAGLPSRFNIKGKLRVDLDEKSALFLQQIALRTVRGVNAAR